MAQTGPGLAPHYTSAVASHPQGNQPPPIFSLNRDQSAHIVSSLKFNAINIWQIISCKWVSYELTVKLVLTNGSQICEYEHEHNYNVNMNI